MVDFNELIAYQANDITTVLVSDLHLSPAEPATNYLEQAFLRLLDKLIDLPNLKQLFILGDWFEAWLGDDVAQTEPMQDWLQPMIEKLKKLSNNGCQIYVMHGNRDFLMGQKFCECFGGKLISEPFYLTLNSQKIRLEHGDGLCTDDKAYQRFRRVIQHPFTKKLLLALPIQKRQQIAQNLRQKSQTDNAKKSSSIMDVNEQAVKQALANADILIHGHTHRPAVHTIGDKKRLVLGDWRIKNKTVEFTLCVVTISNMKLVNYDYPH